MSVLCSTNFASHRRLQIDYASFGDHARWPRSSNVESQANDRSQPTLTWTRDQHSRPISITSSTSPRRLRWTTPLQEQLRGSRLLAIGDQVKRVSGAPSHPSSALRRPPSALRPLCSLLSKILPCVPWAHPPPAALRPPPLLPRGASTPDRRVCPLFPPPPLACRCSI